MTGELNIIVCIKQVPDPEAPVSGYQVDSEARQVIPVGIPPVISPYDENALEMALRLRETYGGKITALSIGHKLSKAVLRKALSVGADELVMVDDEAFGKEKLDGLGTAWVLAGAITKIGAYNLILTGRQASDTNAGVVGLYLAEILGLPAVVLAQKADVEDGKMRVERVMPGGHDIVDTDMPAVITVSSEAGELRSLQMKAMREAKSKPLLHWSSKDIETREVPGKALRIERLSKPVWERKCSFIEADTPAMAGVRLALTLRKDGII
jgi:electron transfer flavoprotein beta subunit